MSRVGVMLFLLGLLILSSPHAQSQRRGSRAPIDRSEYPTWENPSAFQGDTFRFVRIRYSSYRGRYGWGGDWATDYPDAELNFAFRLQQMTSLKVHPEGLVLDLTDPELFNHPFIYMVEPGRLHFSEEEVQGLRRYLNGGGFLMVDDFWGEDEWENFHDEIQRVFPGRPAVELRLDHPIFHCVFDLKEKPQIPSIHAWYRNGAAGITWERHDAQTPHYKGIFDDKNRLMVMICHNTDLGDGWEREGDNLEYFKEFSEKKAYPLGINIIFYALTH